MCNSKQEMNIYRKAKFEHNQHGRSPSRSSRYRLGLGLAGLLLTAGCLRPALTYDPWRVPGGTDAGQPTATLASATGGLATEATPTLQVPRITMTPAPVGVAPTPNAPADLPPLRSETTQYTVEEGDSLVQIALKHQVSVSQIVKANDIEDPSLITPGQVLTIPPASANELATAFKIIPDSELFYSPVTIGFDTASIVWQFNGYLESYREELEDGRTLTGSEIVQEVAQNFSVNPRLLLAVIEHQSGWLRAGNPTSASNDYPLGLENANYRGLYKQLGWAANELTRGYTLWEQRAVSVWSLADDQVMRIDPTINGATAALQYWFSLFLEKESWKTAVSASGFYATYLSLFGFPFAFSMDPVLPADLTQPDLILPFARGDVWSFTGGPHWGWGTGSAWAALDFAPPGGEQDYGCFESQAPVTAAADGLVVRSGNGALVLDLDGDGFEQTGWTLLYLHLAGEGRAEAGTQVKAGDPLGFASCEGGVTTGTHFHIARRYNGLWIDAAGAVPMNLGGWIASSPGIVYDGYLSKDGQTVEAFNGRADFNQIGW